MERARARALPVFLFLFAQSAYAQWRVNTQVDMRAPIYVDMRADTDRAGRVMPNGSIDNRNYTRPPLRLNSTGLGIPHLIGARRGPSRFSLPIWHLTGNTYINGYNFNRHLPGFDSANRTVYGSDPFNLGPLPLATMERRRQERIRNLTGYGPSVKPRSAGTWNLPSLTGTLRGPQTRPIRSTSIYRKPASLKPLTVKLPARTNIISPARRGGSIGASAPVKPLNAKNEKPKTKKLHPDRIRFIEIMSRQSSGFLESDVIALESLTDKYYEWSETRFVLAMIYSAQKIPADRLAQAYAGFLRTCPKNTEMLKRLADLKLTSLETQNLVEDLFIERGRAGKWTIWLDLTWKLMIIEGVFGELNEAIHYMTQIQRFAERNRNRVRPLRVHQENESNGMYWKLNALRKGESLNDSGLNPACK